MSIPWGEEITLYFSLIQFFPKMLESGLSTHIIDVMMNSIIWIPKLEFLETNSEILTTC